MNPRQQNNGGRIACAATKRQSPLPRIGLAWVLSVLLVALGAAVDYARAEDSPSPQMVISERRQTKLALAAWEGQDFEPHKPEIAKGGAFSQVASVHLLAGDYVRAMEQFGHAISLNPTNPSFYRGRGMARLTKGEFDRAVEDFHQAITLNPGSPKAFYGRGMAYSGLNE